MRHGLFALVAVLASQVTVSAGEGRKPNVIVIVGDDMGYGDVGFHGCKDIPTPHLDALAKSGVRCTNGYVTGPYCSPTRAGLLTGRYQNRFGHEFNPTGPAGLPLSQTTFADRLRRLGYVTGLVGKWHLGASDQQHPQARGFDEFFGFLGGAHSYFVNKKDSILRGKTQTNDPLYLTDAFAREAVAFVDKNQAKPFFLYLAFNAVHTPMHADDARLKKFASIADPTRRTYAAMMSAMDDAIGRVLAKLRDAGLEENTLVFFISDNGGPTMPGTTTNGSNNGPLRGSKRTTLEGGIRVPFLVSWKGKLPAGKTYDQPVIQIDFLPTALAAAGAPLDPGFDGVDLLPFLDGRKSDAPHTALFWRFGQQMAVRSGQWSLVKYDAAVEGGAKAKKKAGGTIGPRLYDLSQDLGQTRDLSAQNPDRVRELQTLWDRWNEKNVAPLTEK